MRPRAGLGATQVPRAPPVGATRDPCAKRKRNRHRAGGSERSGEVARGLSDPAWGSPPRPGWGDFPRGGENVAETVGSRDGEGPPLGCIRREGRVVAELAHTAF